MRHLSSVSILLVVAGLVVLAAAQLLGLSPTWALTGLLLAWAGIVKVVVVVLWRGVADPTRAPAVVRDDD